MALPGCPEPGWVSPRLWTLLAVGPVAERRNTGVPAGLTLVSPTLLSGLTPKAADVRHCQVRDTSFHHEHSLLSLFR